MEWRMSRGHVLADTIKATRDPSLFTVLQRP
jgi:hypothetical protein